MTQFKLTLAGKIVIFSLVLLIVLAGVYFTTDGFSSIFKKNVGSVNIPLDISALKLTDKSKSGNIIEVSLDEWIGWKPILDANGGLTTQSGSIYDKLGIKVNIRIINDATQSSTALIKGELNSAGYTINRYAFLYPKFQEAKTPVTMVYITNNSFGGDGIIARKEIKRVEDLVGKKIGVPRFSEAQTLVWWLLSKSDLSKDQVKKIADNMVFFETPDDAAKAFFAGKIDAAATWQPYLTQAQEGTGSHILFSTKSAANIILDGIVFRKDFLDGNPDVVAKFVQGALQASDLYQKDFKAIKAVMPLFAGESNESIKEMTGDAALADYSANKELLASDGLAYTLYTDMCTVWTSIGEKTNPAAVNAAFTDSIIKRLDGQFTKIPEKKALVTAEQRDSAVNKTALLSKSFSIQFQVNSDEFSNREQAYDVLNEIANNAKILNGMIIQIEGNSSSDGDYQANKDLSLKRAKAIAAYLRAQGVEPVRLLTFGNGSDKPVADNNTEAGRIKNRRTDIFFKTAM